MNNETTFQSISDFGYTESQELEVKNESKEKESNEMGNDDYVELVKLREEVKILRNVNDSMRENDFKLREESKFLEKKLKDKELEIFKLTEKLSDQNEKKLDYKVEIGRIKNEKQEEFERIIKNNKEFYLDRIDTLVGLLAEMKHELIAYEIRYGAVKKVYSFEAKKEE